MFKSKFSRLGAMVGTSLSSLALAPAAFAQATPPDYSSLTASIDFSSVVTGVMAVAAALIGVYVAIKGVKFIMEHVKRA